MECLQLFQITCCWCCEDSESGRSDDEDDDFLSVSNPDACLNVSLRKSIEKKDCFGGARSGVRLSPGLYQDFINWCCSFSTGRTVCGRAAGSIQDA